MSTMIVVALDDAVEELVRLVGARVSCRILGVHGHHLVQAGDPGQAFRQPTTGQPGPGFIHQKHVVMIFGPVIPDQQQSHLNLLLTTLIFDTPSASRPGGNLMDQCSTARHPISATGKPDTNRGAISP